MYIVSKSTLRIGSIALLAASALTPAVKAQEFVAGHLLAVSNSSDEIVEYDATGARLRAFGSGAGLVNPYGAAFGPNGHLYVASYNNDKLLELSAAGTVVKDIALPYTDQPVGVAISPEGNIYVTGDDSANVVELDPDGAHVRVVKSSITDCRGILLMPDGSLLVGGYSSGRKLFKVSLTGTTLDSWPIANGLIYGLAMGPDGQVYVGLNVLDNIYISDPSTQTTTNMAGGGTSERFTGVAFAPQRFQAKLSGKIARQGVDPKTRNESCVASMSPFSSWVMIQLVDDVVNPDDLATIFGADALVLSGRNVAASKIEKQLFVGAQASRKVLADGMASAQLSLQLAAGAGESFSLKKISGAISRDAGAATFTGKLTTSKKLN
jgi:streptogramin lyase